MAKLSPKQKKIAAKAGDPNKIEGADFAKIRQEKESGVGPMQMTTGNTPPFSGYASRLMAKGIKAVASHLVNKTAEKLKKEKEASDFAKKGAIKGPTQTNTETETDKVGYSMQRGSRETDSPTTFRTDAIMRMGPMLMNHDKPVDTSSYSADTSSAYSQGSFQGSGGGNFITDRNETTSTSTEVIPGDTTTETKTVTYDDLYNNAISDGKTPEEAQKIVQEARDYNMKTYGTHNPTAEIEGVNNTITTTTQGDDQIIETTNTEVDESPRTVKTTQKTKREIRKDRQNQNQLDKDLRKTSRRFQRGLKKFGMEGLTPGSKEYQAKYNQLNEFQKDQLKNLQRNYDTAKTSKDYFFEGKDQNASFGDQFNTGERETFAQTDFRNQKNKNESGKFWAEKFKQDGERFSSQIGKNLFDTSNLSNLGMPKTTSDSDFMSNIFGNPSFSKIGMVKPMQFRAQGGGKASRTGKSKSGGLNIKNNY